MQPMQNMRVVNVPHLKRPGRRKPFRHHACLSPAATDVNAGFGMAGYGLGIAGPVRISEGRT